MSIARNPLPIPLVEVGLSMEKGQNYYNSIIYYGMSLVRIMGYTDLMPPVWAALYLYGFGSCQPYKFVEWLPFLRRAGLKDEDDERVQLVVKIISGHAVMYDDARTEQLMEVVHDAILLSSVITGECDPSLFKLNRTEGFIVRAYNLMEGMDQPQPWPEFFEEAVRVFNPHRGTAAEMPDVWNEAESGNDRMIRRCQQSQFKNTLQTFMGNSEAVLAKFFWKTYPELNRWLGRYDEVLKKVSIASDGIPVSYMKTQELLAFRGQGFIKSPWEQWADGEETWHSRYQDLYQDAKAYGDKRLFGEKAQWMTLGSFHCKMTENADAQLRERLGSRRIVWKAELLKSATLTVMDHQMNTYAVPFLPSHVRRMSLLYMVFLTLHSKLLGREKNGLLDGLIPYQVSPEYYELQFHRKVTPDDILHVD